MNNTQKTRDAVSFSDQFNLLMSPDRIAKLAIFGIFSIVYIAICLISGYITTHIINHELTYVSFPDKATTQKWGISVYEDVTIEPNSLTIPEGEVRLGNAFLAVGRYRRFTIPFVPGIVLANKYSLKHDRDWLRIQIRFDVMSRPASKKPYYRISILEDPMGKFLRHYMDNGTQYAIDVTNDQHEQYHGYIVYGEKKVEGTDFVISVNWKNAQSNWRATDKVWFPGYSDPCESN